LKDQGETIGVFTLMISGYLARRYQYHRSPPFIQFDEYHRVFDFRNFRFLTIFNKDYQGYERLCNTKKISET